MHNRLAIITSEGAVFDVIDNLDDIFTFESWYKMKSKSTKDKIASIKEVLEGSDEDESITEDISDDVAKIVYQICAAKFG